MSRLLLGACVALALALGAGCGGPSRRSISAAVVDQTSGTAYAFEVDDSRRGGDYSVVIFCNQALPAICYRASPQDVRNVDELRALRLAIDTIRVRRADEARVRVPAPPETLPTYGD